MAKINSILDQFTTEKIFDSPPLGGSIVVELIEDGVANKYAFKNPDIAKDMQNPNDLIWYVIPEESYEYLNNFFQN